MFTTPANVDGNDGVIDSVLGRLDGVLRGLLLFSDAVRSPGILFNLRLPASLLNVGVAEREFCLLGGFEFPFFLGLLSTSESLLSELKSLDESRFVNIFIN